MSNEQRGLRPGSLLWWVRWAQQVSCLADAPTAKSVLVALALETREENGNKVWPSVARLAERTSFKRSAILAALARLEGNGLIERQPRYRLGGTEGGRTSTLYRLLPSRETHMVSPPDGRAPIQQMDGGHPASAPHEETIEETTIRNHLSPQPRAAAGRTDELEASFSELCANWPEPIDEELQHRAFKTYKYAVQQGADELEILRAVEAGEAADYRDLRGWLWQEYGRPEAAAGTGNDRQRTGTQ